MLYEDITEQIIGCSYNVLDELGSGFLESVYQNALIIVLREKGLQVEAEKRINVYFRQQVVGVFEADLFVNNAVIVEFKCCQALSPNHSSQVINYLQASRTSVGLLINFGNFKLEFKRLYSTALQNSMYF